MSTSPLPQTSTTTSTTTTDTFTYPPHHSFPPFYTLQPNQTTLTRQLTLWSTLITSHSAHHKTFKLSLTSTSTPTTTHTLFSNPRISRSLDPLAIRQILDFMSSSCSPPLAEFPTGQQDGGGMVVWIWWRSPAEWADKIAAWVDETGQKGVVLTIYELRESDAVKGQEWVGMDEDMLRKCLDVLVKKGRAQVFGQVDGSGVKFF